MHRAYHQYRHDEHAWRAALSALARRFRHGASHRRFRRFRRVKLATCSLRRAHDRRGGGDSLAGAIILLAWRRAAKNGTRIRTPRIARLRHRTIFGGAAALRRRGETLQQSGIAFAPPRFIAARRKPPYKTKRGQAGGMTAPQGASSALNGRRETKRRRLMARRRRIGNSIFHRLISIGWLQRSSAALQHPTLARGMAMAAARGALFPQRSSRCCSRRARASA